MIQGFKEFISRGNAMEMAVGVAIGAAFATVVDSIVEKFINPLVGGIFGKPNFDSLGAFTLGEGADAATVYPGAILTALVNFLFVALAIYFVIVVPMNKLAERRSRGKEPEQEILTPDQELLTEIRDLLARR